MDKPVAAGRPSVEPSLLRAPEVAEKLGISRSHLYKLNSSGRLPRPVRLGGSVRWPADELAAWTAAGCPSRDKWEVISQGGKWR